MNIVVSIAGLFWFGQNPWYVKQPVLSRTNEQPDTVIQLHPYWHWLSSPASDLKGSQLRDWWLIHCKFNASSSIRPSLHVHAQFSTHRIDGRYLMQRMRKTNISPLHQKITNKSKVTSVCIGLYLWTQARLALVLANLIVTKLILIAFSSLRC